MKVRNWREKCNDRGWWNKIVEQGCSVGGGGGGEEEEEPFMYHLTIISVALQARGRWHH